MVRIRLPSISPALRIDLRLAVVQQVPLLILTGLLLDGGDLARWTAAAVIGFWLGVAAIARKRAEYRRPSDRWFVKWGSVPLIVMAWAIEPIVHHAIRW